MSRDFNFYDEQSKKYSQVRYPSVTFSYNHHLFKNRLKKVLRLISKFLSPHNRYNLLEIGCADGIVIRTLHNAFPGAWKGMKGVDISENMIKTAKGFNKNMNIQFSVRNDDELSTYDFIVELGVTNYLDYEQELKFVSQRLTKTGVYICSFAGNSSSWWRLKGEEGIFTHLLPYSVYEKTMSEYFHIEKVVPVALFVPYLWKIPQLARLLQPFIDIVFSLFAPNLFHEKIYLLRSKAK